MTGDGSDVMEKNKPGDKQLCFRAAGFKMQTFVAVAVAHLKQSEEMSRNLQALARHGQ